MLQLNTLQARVPIVEQDRVPTSQMVQLVQALVQHIQDLERRLAAAGIP